MEEEAKEMNKKVSEFQSRLKYHKLDSSISMMESSLSGQDESQEYMNGFSINPDGNGST